MPTPALPPPAPVPVAPAVDPRETAIQAAKEWELPDGRRLGNAARDALAADRQSVSLDGRALDRGTPLGQLTSPTAGPPGRPPSPTSRGGPRRQDGGRPQPGRQVRAAGQSRAAAGAAEAQARRDQAQGEGQARGSEGQTQAQGREPRFSPWLRRSRQARGGAGESGFSDDVLAAPGEASAPAGEAPAKPAKPTAAKRAAKASKAAAKAAPKEGKAADEALLDDILKEGHGNHRRPEADGVDALDGLRPHERHEGQA